MSNQEKILIYEVLDMFNEEAGYKGLDNKGKKTDDRDDVIPRQTFNNWVVYYNKTHERPIKSRKIDQYNSEWYKSDIQKLLKTERVQKNLENAFLRETVPLFEGLGFASTRVSRKYKEAKEELFKEANSGGLSKSVKNVMDQLLNEIINRYFKLSFKGKQINGMNYINEYEIVNDFIDIKKLEDEAFKIVDNYYGVPEYNEDGNIIHVHNQKEIRKLESFLKEDIDQQLFYNCITNR